MLTELTATQYMGVMILATIAGGFFGMTWLSLGFWQSCALWSAAILITAGFYVGLRLVMS
jgi:hypothetical protein